MKSVLISIQPKWCELIASGKKTVEVRKTRPKLETPFKCYIYMTAGNAVYPVTINGAPYTCSNVGGKCVIGEFVCDKVQMSFVGYNEKGCPSYWDILDGSCLTPNELVCYGEWKTLYGWHISDLVIYDKPRELCNFKKPCIRECDCGGCENAFWTFENGFEGCMLEWGLQRPPQSWCYVEG